MYLSAQQTQITDRLVVVNACIPGISNDFLLAYMLTYSIESNGKCTPTRKTYSQAYGSNYNVILPFEKQLFN
jgi:hypothetical protein